MRPRGNTQDDYLLRIIRQAAEALRRVETLARGLGGRPHWGKRHFRAAADLAPAYPKWADFQAARKRMDPDGVFTNAYTDRVLGPVA